MKISKCKICDSKNRSIIWFDKIRVGKKFSKNKVKIFHCENCKVRYKESFDKRLNNNKIFRKIYDGANTISKYKDFNEPREINKIEFIERFINLEKKSILETNCGAASILDYLKKKRCVTAGQDHIIYRNHIMKNHIYYEDIAKIKDKKYDIILSLAEIEHTVDVISFVNSLKKILAKNGKLVFRIPNYENIYYYMLGYNFQKYDFRSSHNFYFCEKSLDYLFKKTNMKIISKQGFNEYDIDHLFCYLKTKKRVKTYEKIFNKRLNKLFLENINNLKLSTSLIYILSKN